eukprot:CAMPEP_0184865524 /NCGR_PEP_ID=MMETSP0580-20130426/18389_1 /TAXON_ID=1118495 /ORGANISM="Dactyliosolen fragilissimus" /LENGTH=364 /DNA_ID=CAMNT_0027364771 /DNA_START=192 /DNA_END=1283 /DNA_ORIENTATION=+
MAESVPTTVVENKRSDGCDESQKHSLSPIVASNSSQYTWTGQHFIPPKGVPTFTPTEFQSYFKKRNALFIGDSTGRRAYATLFAIMNSTDPSNIRANDMDSPNVIDFNKARNRQERCLIPERRLNAFLNSSQYICRNVSMNNAASSNSTSTNTIAIGAEDTTSSLITGKFDFFPQACLSESYNFFTNQSFLDVIQEEYDLIVYTLGIWEGVRQHDCKMTVPVNEDINTTAAENLRIVGMEEKFSLALEVLSSASSPNLQIAFRTPGFSADHNGDGTMLALNEHIRCHSMQLVADLRADDDDDDLDENHGENPRPKKPLLKSTNFTVVDWGTVISKRSYEDRIVGDLKPHYGLEARLLFAQQLLH